MFEANASNDQLRNRFAKFHETFRADAAYFVRKGQRDGTIRKGPTPDREGELLIAGIRGIGYQWMLDPRGFDPARALKYLRDTTQERLALPEESRKQ